MSEELEDIRTRLAAKRGANEEFARRVQAWADELTRKLAESQNNKKAMPRALRAQGNESQKPDDNEPDGAAQM